MTEMIAWIDRLETAMISTDETLMNKIIEEAKTEMTPLDLAEKVISSALRRLGKGWEEGTISLSQVYLAGNICANALDRLLPAASQVRKDQPKVAIAVLEDYHNLGQKIVWSLLRASGIEVSNFERQTVQSLVTKAKEDGIEILLVSTLMYRSALKVKDLREQLEKETIKPFLMVGGAPFIFDRELWKQVGADEFGEDASSSILMINKRSGYEDER